MTAIMLFNNVMYSRAIEEKGAIIECKKHRSASSYEGVRARGHQYEEEN